MKVIILEDEKLAVERLNFLLRQIDPGTQVVAELESVEQSIALFDQRVPNVDLLLMDIHLADGSVFDLFRHVKINIPIIFTTAYDHYAIDAFKVLSIDYLLKPITLESLARPSKKCACCGRIHHCRDPIIACWESTAPSAGITSDPGCLAASAKGDSSLMRLPNKPKREQPIKEDFDMRQDSVFAFRSAATPDFC